MAPGSVVSSGAVNKPSFCFFITIVEVNDTCMCLNHTGRPGEDTVYQSVKTASVFQLVVGIVGLAATVLSFFVTTSMVFKACPGNSTTAALQGPKKPEMARAMAVHMTVLSVYNVLRILAGLLIATSTLGWDGRSSLQKVSGFLWLMGTWGNAWTILDMSLGRIVKAWMPQYLKLYKTEKILCRSVFILLAASVVNGQMIAHTLIDKGSDCSMSRYWFMYRAGYSLYFLMAVHFLTPQIILTLVVLCLLIITVVKQQPRYLCVLSIAASYTVSSGVATVYFTSLMQCGQNNIAHDRHFLYQGRLHFGVTAELLCYLNAASSAFLYCLWPRFLKELKYKDTSRM